MGNRLYKRLHFPSITKSYRFDNIAYLGIGGNMGDTKRLFEKLFWCLQRDRTIDILETSPILKNPPFGYLDQNDFYNAVIKISTLLEPKKLLTYLQGIERRFGRIRSFQNAPRTLDIDIIFYNDLAINSKFLILPHPHWHKRASVVIPLHCMGMR